MRLKVWTVVGTRPEIIRLSSTIKLFDRLFDHTLIHTGQNSGEKMSEVFFKDLELRDPDYFLDSKGTNLGELLGDMFSKFGKLIRENRPDAMVVLGDTNSALSMILARREGIATYHLEAGNRAFDARVPEEVNRRLIDHTADFNLAYNSYSYGNLLREGLPPGRTYQTGSPMREVIESIQEKIDKSQILESLKLEENKFLVGSFHRQENVNSLESLANVVDFVSELSERLEMRMVFPVHPRTMDRLKAHNLSLSDSITAIEPLGIVDYLRLQQGSFATISDSGTLAEESSLLGFVGVSAREATERPEAHQLAKFSLTGLSVQNCIEAIRLQGVSSSGELPEGYEERNFSQRVANVVSSTARRRDFLVGDFSPNAPR